MDDEKNPHRVTKPWSEKAYFAPSKSDNGYTVACGINDNPTRCTITPRNGGNYPTVDFELPRQNHELSKIDLLMQRAYERGRADNRKELGSLLKDLVDLSMMR